MVTGPVSRVLSMAAASLVSAVTAGPGDENQAHLSKADKNR